MKTKNMRKKALMSSLAMLLVAVVALSSATYAWFTSSKTATISQITVSAESSSGIQISDTGMGNWNTVLNVPETEVPTKFKPVSVWADNLGTASFYKGTVSTYSDDATDARYGQQVISVAASTPSGTQVTSIGQKNSKSATYSGSNMTDAGDDYLVKHFFVKVDQQEVLRIESLNITETTTGSGVDPIVRAARVALVRHGTYNKTNLVTNDSDISSAVVGRWVYEPNATAHNDATITGAQDTYAVKAAFSDNTLLSTVFATAYSSGGTDYTQKVTNTAPVETTDPAQVQFTDNPAASGATYDNFTIQKGITWLTLYIWIEGQDIDCLNEISGGSFNVDMKLTIDS